MSEIEENKPDFSPFVRIGEYLSTEFLDKVEHLLFLVGSYGISKVSEPLASKASFTEFSMQVHEGWKQAQRQMVPMLLDAIGRRDAAEQEVKRQHALKNTDAKKVANKDLGAAKIEIAFLRRTLDVALWTIAGGDHSLLRRLFVAGGRSNFSAENIQSAMLVAEKINENKNAVALCTDILSDVHVGDLLVSDVLSGKTTFVELKEGEKNIEITKAVKFALESGCEYFEHQTLERYDKTDHKQYERVKKQAVRNQTIIDTIRNEAGTDPNTGAIVNIQRVEDAPRLWSQQIIDCCGRLNSEQPWALSTIDECVHMAAYSRQDMAFVGFCGWMDRIKCDSPIYNLMDSFRIPSARPLGATHLPRDLQVKILRGEILVIICLDLDRLIEVANKKRPGLMRLASKRETMEARKFKLALLEHRGRVLQLKMDDVVENLGGGFRDRVVFDQHSPSQLIDQHIETVDARRVASKKKAKSG